MRLWTYWPSLTSLFAGRQPSYLSAGMSILECCVYVLILQLISSFKLIIFWYLKPSRLERQSLVTNTSAPFLSITWIWIVTISKLASVWKSKVCRQSCAQDHMNNRIPWHTYHYIGDTSGPSTTCKFVIMHSDLNSISMCQSLKVWVSPHL